MRYSLTDYILSIKLPTSLSQALNLDKDVIEIGGEGSYLDSITISLNSNLVETTADSTGSWIHDFNYAKNGTISISINQVSAKIARFKQITNIFYNAGEKYEGLTLTVTNRAQEQIVDAKDCYFQRIPDQNYQNTAQNQTWILTCGAIYFN